MSSGVDDLIGAMRHAARTVRSVVSSTPDELRALAAARDAIDAAMADRLAEFDRVKGFVVEDASSTSTWARRELRQDAGRTRAMVRAADTMRQLPQVGESARSGRISAEHVDRFSFALAHIEPDEVRRVESHLVTVAEAFQPSRLKALVDRMRSALYPEELDQAWIRGMEKADVNLHAVPDGWHVTGFLPTDVGAKFKAMLRALSVPRESGDGRTAAARRVDGLDEFLTRVLAEGLPTDGTVRPQIHVTVDAGQLKAALAPDTDSAFTPAEPALLVGFGHIGPNLLAHLTCGADLIPVLIDRIERNATVLDVGRRHREATAKQRHAIWITQNGRCHTDHCANAIDHIHHPRRWSDGGPTDLVNLVGLCTTCHRHQHRHDHQQRGTPLARVG